MLGVSLRQKESATKNQLLRKGKERRNVHMLLVYLPLVLYMFFVSAPGAGLPGTPE